MNVTADRRTLAEALRQVQVPAHHDVPALAHVKLVAADGQLTLSRSDLDVTAAATIDVDVHTAGTALPHARTLQRLLRTGGDTVTLVADGTTKNPTVTVHGHANVTVDAVRPGEFPKLPRTAPTTGTLTADDIATLRHVTEAASTERPELEVVVFEDGHAIACDAYRMHQGHMSDDASGTLDTTMVAAAELAGPLRWRTDQIRVAVADGRVQLHATQTFGPAAQPRTVQTTRTIVASDVHYPNWRHLIGEPDDTPPERSNTTLGTVSTLTALDALEAVADTVTLGPDADGQPTLAAVGQSGPAAAQLTGTIPADLEPVGFTLAFLRDAVAASDVDGTVRAHLRRPDQSALFDSGGPVRVLLMPVTVPA